MKTNLAFRALALLILTTTLACQFSDATPRADPNAHNTMVALTAQVAQIQTAAALPPTNNPPPPGPSPAAPPPAALAPTLSPTPAGPTVLLNVTLSLPRHMALDLDTQATSGPHNTTPVEKYHSSLPGKDVLFYGPYNNLPDYQFLALLNTARIALPPQKLTDASYQNCVNVFAQGDVFGVGLALISFPLDVNTFMEGGLPGPGGYLCFVTDQGRVGAMLITTRGDFIGAQSVTISYILWDARLP